ncbi:uncharacterized protein L969DRAFT_65070 [Mixia osmundae IAM 14324]|uniref:Inactive metallocarboxypeptidase ECM14 n=1 Tax=Mixia osmundae (strain CBS 9802 / IAM 14324 / JCM 22182 / KY 12970) TaxID=764103 RepID=G7DWS5_MIXOS|nr:uncharacterized protein L969DRAFT_20560 [Mixia osmundae IAM 14324]XP_014566729.1 uncharacterized protein L969DRAFT_65070 [Mixia osmundae IAM 14324]KEI36200.1 hypothetical protein L969DRAFT_20560 [Mixia osmundae IAM 14324]KEI38168.1 hypothetical protein L969DRAFT_65070 [Mixia osmundae IAM 14324]GAA95022.1 hypothetical protein E5Q_01677 [Mixia osmundae IAM 14324]
MKARACVALLGAQLAVTSAAPSVVANNQNEQQITFALPTAHHPSSSQLVDHSHDLFLRLDSSDASMSQQTVQEAIASLEDEADLLQASQSHFVVRLPRKSTEARHLPHSLEALRDTFTMSTSTNPFENATAHLETDPGDIHSIFHPPEAINSILSMLASDYPALARVVNLGKSYEGRDILGLKISNFEHDHPHSSGGPPCHKRGHHRHSHGHGRHHQRHHRHHHRSGFVKHHWHHTKHAVRSFYYALRSRLGLSVAEEYLHGGHRRHRHPRREWSKKAVRRQKGRHGYPDKLGFLVTGGAHAREWIAPSTVLYMASEILREAASTEVSAKLQRILNVFEITFVPTVNPDGYSYTFTDDRLWKKTRQPVGQDCFGIDINRNFGYHWAQPYRPNPCNEVFPGYRAFDSVESLRIADYVLDEANDVTAYLDVHSFGQQLMFPFSYSCEVQPGDAENLYEAALDTAKAIRSVHGSVFETGSRCEISYTAAGDSLDWTYGAAGVVWSYAAELRDLGVYGFLLPPEEIKTVGQESLAGLLDLAAFVAAKEDGHLESWEERKRKRAMARDEMPPTQ